ncbi:hypothetical protein DDB_G0287663 [Dictyostelium discoideum AX4]|uniref:Tetratricopeptide repeat protein n=1 Tax=Dictyostelium discoideum TaxID=44689 RepID=Q54K41_DICDI|nr:hypothetical protein DDB_G0287663 [Dictyostelium discoideum AX4]EAL63640.1 hypothetical protein DDB_G0287663 [Dictyostelium discoideum AX4]|eukprot:XP_637123.1 hypothetical protein DDB_G0287663 [Dictyostelium discoideum AX4]
MSTTNNTPTPTPTSTPQYNKPSILSPVRLLEKLSKIDEGSRENTPIPSTATLLMITGMQSIGKNQKVAGEKLTKALEAAEKNKNQEELAAALLGLGYFYITTTDYDKSIQLYNASLAIWKQIHGNDFIHLADLILDIAKIYQCQNNEVEFKKTIESYQTLFKNNNKTPPTTCG